ncbi:MAG TPA: polyphosphate polymerase domain-containing protein [Candidatus Krumholzibacteria bacterium]
MPAPAYVRSFNRFEFKYVVPHDVMRAFIGELEGYTVADRHSNGVGGYPVYSLYWDSPVLDFFWEKIDGQKYRRKLRLRRYTDGEYAFVEIKQRTNRTVQKRRTRLPTEQVRALFRDGAIDLELENEVKDPALTEALFLCRQFDLRPQTAVAYQRRAFFGAHESDLRITFDTRLQYDPRALDIGEPFEVGKTLVDPRLAIMEIKFNHRVPLWLTKLVSRHGLRIERYSKYCAAVDRELFAGRYT